MDRNFARSLSLVLKEEGGFVNDPHDPGGATNKGITIATYRRYVNSKGTADDLKRITAAEVAKVYKRQYWDAVQGDDLPDGIDYAVFDFAVNSGPGRAAKFLQRILGVAVDGKIGPATISAAKASFKASVINTLSADRLEFLKGLPTWNRYRKGWSARVARVKSAALDMADAAALSRPPPAPVEAPKPAPATPEPPKAQPAPAPAPVPPTAPPKTGIAMFFALIVAGLGIAWAWIAALPCDWFGLFCK